MRDDILAPESMEIQQRCLPKHPNLATIPVTNAPARRLAKHPAAGKNMLKVLLKPNPKSIIEEIGI